MSLPKLSFHRLTSRFYVWQDGKRVYLGRGDDPAKPSMEILAKCRKAVRRILARRNTMPKLVPEMKSRTFGTKPNGIRPSPWCSQKYLLLVPSERKWRFNAGCPLKRLIFVQKMMRR